MEELTILAAEGRISLRDFESAVLTYALTPAEEAQPTATRYGRFVLDDYTDSDSYHYFRFAKQDLRTLTVLLKIPDIVRTPQRYSVSGLEGLCILLRRLSYPNRLRDLEPMFGVSMPYLSIITNRVADIIWRENGHLLTDMSRLKWLNSDRLRIYAEVVHRAGAPIDNCWGFIDGTARPICKPGVNQELYYSGHKRCHCLKYQTIACPDGMVVSGMGPYPGRRHDAFIFGQSGVYHQLEALLPNRNYVLYGDSAYPISELLLKPYSTANISSLESDFNTEMSAVRTAVEWSYQKILRDFAFLDFKKNQKLLLQDLSTMYRTAIILSNCHSCLYGNQTSSYFGILPVTLPGYLNA